MNIKSKFRITKPAIISFAAILGIIIPTITKAGFWGNVGKDIISTLGEVVQFCLNGLFKISASLFEGALGIGFDNRTAEVIKTGWTACRDFANMLFIPAMVIIAFATILRIEQYGIKKLLPKIIGIALLINFSFVLCSAIVDFSNITADFFIKDIKGKISNQSGETTGLITAQFADAFNITGIYTTVKNCDEILKLGILDCDRWYYISIPGQLDLKAACYKTYADQADTCKKQGGLTVKTDDSTFLNVLLGYTIGSIVMITAIFTLSAGALMILFRIVAIWFLITIVPLVFICYVLPGLEDNWKKWWTKFLHWCIFAPVYTFFIWMAIQIAVTKANTKMGIDASQFAISGDYNAVSNAFQNNPGGELISYLIIIGFLMGSLVVAQTLSIYGASAAMSIVTKTKAGVTGWAKRKATRPLEAGGKIAGAGTLGLGAKLFKGTKWGGRMDAKATQIAQSRAQTPENKKYANLLNTMSDTDVEKEILSAGGARKLIAVQTAKKRGLLRETDKETTKQSMKTLKGFGDTEGLRSLEELRPDVIDDDKKRDKTVEKMGQEGNLNKIPAIALKDERVIATMERFASAVQIESLRNTSPQHAENLKSSLNTLTTAGNAILASMSALDQEKIHHSYASQTGDISRMTVPGQLENWAKKAGADGIKRISSTNPSAKMHTLADLMPTNQLAAIVEKIQDNVAARSIVGYLSTATNPAAAANSYAVNHNPYLRTLI